MEVCRILHLCERQPFGDHRGSAHRHAHAPRHGGKGDVGYLRGGDEIDLVEAKSEIRDAVCTLTCCEFEQVGTTAPGQAVIPRPAAQQIVADAAIQRIAGGTTDQRIRPRSANDRIRPGPVHVAIAILRDGDGIRFVSRRWRIGPLPLPRWALPGGNAMELDDAGRFGFAVEIRVPLVGQVVAYRGWLAQAS